MWDMSIVYKQYGLRTRLILIFAFLLVSLSRLLRSEQNYD